MTRKLYLRLYVAFLGVLLAVVAVVAGINIITGRAFATIRSGPRIATHLSHMVDMRHDALDKVVEELHDGLEMDVSVFGPNGELLASAGAPSRATRPASRPGASSSTSTRAKCWSTETARRSPRTSTNCWSRSRATRAAC